MLKMKKITEAFEMRVFTDTGEYFGDIEESIITQNKIFGWRVRATKNSFLNKVLGSAKGVIVPHQLVKSIDQQIQQLQLMQIKCHYLHISVPHLRLYHFHLLLV